MSVSVVRLMNTFGPRQSARAVIPTIISQALVKDDVHLGTLEPKMDFNYVSDSLEAFLLAAERAQAQGKILTWGSGVSTSIADLAQEIFSLVGRKELHVVTDKERVRPYAGPMPSLETDVLTTREILGFTPRVSLRDGLQKTINWISDNVERYKTDMYAV